MSYLELLNLFLQFYIKPSLALVVMLLLFKKNNAHSAQYCFWALLTSLIIGLLSLLLCTYVSAIHTHFPTVKLFTILQQLKSSLTITLPPIASSLQHANPQAQNLTNIFIVTYSVVTLLLLARCSRQFIKAYCIVRSANSVEMSQLEARLSPLKHSSLKGINIKESPVFDVPRVWSTSPPTLLLPSNWAQWKHAQLSRVLEHELAHIRRKDWLIKSCLQLLLSLCWILIPLWAVYQRLAQYAEFSCDDAVLKAGHRRETYAEDLMALASQCKLNSAFIAFNSSTLSERIYQVLEGGRDSNEVSKIKKSAIISTCIALFLPFFLINITVSQYTHTDSQPALLTFAEWPENTPNNASENTNAHVISRPQISELRPIVPLDSKPLQVQINFERNVSLPQPRYNLKPYIAQPKISLSQLKIVNLEAPVSSLSTATISEYTAIKVIFDVDPYGKATNIRFHNSGINKRLKASIEEALTKSKFIAPVINEEAISVLNIPVRYVF